MRAIVAVFACAISLVVAGCGGGGDSNAPAEKKINILWAKWAPADALQKLSEEYTKKTGIVVTINQKPWADYGAVKGQEFANRSDTYDIIIGDSQWIGQGVVGGHYVELTDLIKQHTDTFADVAPAAKSFYAEYPKGSQRYYAVACESDAMAIAYRKDLFEDPKHQAAFKEFLKKNTQPEFELAVPKTWEQLYWISNYFKNGSGIEGMAGIVMPTVASYDQATMSFQSMLWAFGGDWGDQHKLTATIGSPDATAALAFMKKLIDTSSAQGATMDYGDVLSTYTSGRSAMAMTYFAFFPAFNSPTDNRDYHAKTGYFNVPAGPKGRFTALGGQGMSVNAHISPARQHQAKEYLVWFSGDDIQTEWARLGGFTAHTKILKTDAFLKAAPYNGLFEEAFGMMRDFWNIPEYDQLLTVAQNNISATLQGRQTPEEATKIMQAEHENILKTATK